MQIRCTVCGRVRDPFTAAPVNVAGRPSRLGGAVTGALGWMILGVGLFAALVVGLVFQALFPAGYLGIALGLTIGIASAVAGSLLLAGSKRLHTSGASAERLAQERTVFALGAHLGGTVTAVDAARALGISAGEADALLTDMAKRHGDRVRLEVDDDGNLYFAFPEVTGPVPRRRVLAPRPEAAEPPPAEEPGEELEGEIEEPYAGRTRQARAPRRGL